MGDKSKIEWTDATWNILVGCSRVSPGCDHCYAIGVAHRGMSPQHRGLTIHPEGERVDWNGQINEVPHLLDQPLRWRRPRRIFVNSLSDLFHPDVDEGFIGSVWNTMALSPQHTFQILTKRPQRMAKLLTAWAAGGWMWRRSDMMWCGPTKGPLPNVWLGVSVENQRYADLRIPHLIATPAAVRFLSVEPLLGSVELRPHLRRISDASRAASEYEWSSDRVDWVIVGGESGPGARVMDLDWAVRVVDECAHWNVPAFVKQLGSHYGRAHQDITTFPESLRVREYPRVVQ